MRASATTSARCEPAVGRRAGHHSHMKLVVVEFMTLDGVMEAPGFEEHPRGRNAWAMRVNDAELQAYTGEQVMGADALLFGRRTFNIWAAFWPTAPDVAAAMGKRITALPKYVVSKTLVESDWANTLILRGNLGDEIRRVKDEPGGEVLVYGSADLVAALLDLDLVDELRLMLFPVVLGSGKRLFGEASDKRTLRLADSKTVGDGIVILTLERVRA
jgi:dihydrofolate reductase